MLSSPSRFPLPSRFEFMEIVVRIGITKFISSKKKATGEDIVKAVKKILEEHFALNTAPGSCNCEIHHKSTWRRENL